MPIRIIGSFSIGSKPKDAKTMKIKNPVFLTADRKKAVPAGHPDAASVLCGANAEVLEKTVKEYGLTENGAPGQKAGERGPIIAHTVNENCRDGVNTSADAPAATPQGPKVRVEPVKEPAAPKAEQPATEPKGKAKKSKAGK